jgi:hypothetical protein
VQPLQALINEYFEKTIAECAPGGSLPLRYLREAVSVFLNSPSAATADEVYNSFFDIFRMRKEGFAFFDILDALRSYESQTSGLTEHQRDHFTHSVWVFLLGLGIYAGNVNYRCTYINSSAKFLYQWGMASLLHDIGYPVEIVFNQFKQYVEKMIDVDEDSNKPNPHLDYGNMRELLHLHDSGDKSFIDYLSEHISASLSLDAETVSKALSEYPNIKGTSGYVDHGFYSAIMMMRWTGLLLEKSSTSPAAFDTDVIPAAAAILLHNFYNRPLQSQLKLPPLNASKHPLAFLLMLCDELQEWDRAAYGSANNHKPIVEKCDVSLSDDSISALYQLSTDENIDANAEATKFSDKKITTLNRLLALKEVFADLSEDFIKATATATKPSATAPSASRTISPRPTLDDLETVSKVIHENYRRKNPDKPLSKLSWDECDDHFRYDNVSQARHLFNAVTRFGYLILTPEDAKAFTLADSIPAHVVEEFARAEHARWMASKLRDGFIRGTTNDDKLKTRTTLVPYDDLPETEKNKECAPLIEFSETLKIIGKNLYFNEEENSNA